MHATVRRRRDFWSGRLVGLASVVAVLVFMAVLFGGPSGFLPQPATSQAAEVQGLLLLKAKGEELLREGIVDRVQAIVRGAQVERYLFLKAEPHDVIGIEPGRAGRIIQGGKVLTAKLERGRWFNAEDRNVAVVGEVYREDYMEGMPGPGMGTPHAMMKHPFEIGSTFNLRDSPQRLRVIGEFTAHPKEAAAKVLLPLASAQKLFNKEGSLSHLVLVVEPAERVEQVKGELAAALGDTFEIISQR
ncbi:MAG: ABC transporter permease [Nitrospinae bacterium]|nr:ABC transporter permease [Nitrospinota bacterium]